MLILSYKGQIKVHILADNDLSMDMKKFKGILEQQLDQEIEECNKLNF